MTAIEQRLSLAGLRCQTHSRSDGSQVIEGLQVGHWYRIVLGAKWQRVEWRVVERDGEILISSDFRLFPWYALLTLAVGAGSGILFLLAFGWFGPIHPAAAIGIGLTGATLVIVCLYMLAALGGHRTDALWQSVLARIESEGRTFAPEISGLRYPLAMIGYAVSLLALTAWIMLAEPSGSVTRAPTWMIVFWVTLLALVMVLLAVASLLFVRAFNLRTVPLLVGLTSSLSVFFFLALPMPWLASALSAPDVHSAIDVRQDTGAVVPTIAERLLRAGQPLDRRSWRLVSWLLLTTSALLAGGALALALYSALVTLNGWGHLHRLRELRGEHGVYRDALRPGVVLRLVQTTFFTLCALLGLANLSGLILAVSCAVVAACPSLPTAAELHLAELSAALIAMALGRPPDDSLIDAIVRAGWIAFGLGALALPAVSLGSLLLARVQTRRRLEGADVSSAAAEKLQNLVNQFLRNNWRETGAIRVILSNRCEHFGPAPAGAESIRIGLLRPHRYIEVSQGALDTHPPEQLEALIAHELAHHLLGHCIHWDLFRWLGRVTFVGDGFASALLDSFGFELAADRFARDELGVSADALAACLVGVAVSPESRAPGPNATYRPFHTSSDFLSLPARKRLRLAWQLFLDQYTGRGDLHYWHPHAADRIRSLRIEVR